MSFIEVRKVVKMYDDAKDKANLEAQRILETAKETFILKK